MSNTFLLDNPDMLEVLEKDLIKKIKSALTAAGVSGCVHGVFSLDDLEKKTADELCAKIAFGVGYLGASPITEHTAQTNPAKGNAIQVSDVRFMVLVAAPVDDLCSQRLTGMKLLTILRQGILGTSIEEVPGQPAGRNQVQRSWVFVQEKPEVSESTETMLYYTQQWRLSLPMKGN
jgi:hypothetical protein